MSSEQRRENYSCDITYVTNSELGFDYLRDNLAMESKSFHIYFLCILILLFYHLVFVLMFTAGQITFIY